MWDEVMFTYVIPCYKQYTAMRMNNGNSSLRKWMEKQ